MGISGHQIVDKPRCQWGELTAETVQACVQTRFRRNAGYYVVVRLLNSLRSTQSPVIGVFYRVLSGLCACPAHAYYDH